VIGIISLRIPEYSKRKQDALRRRVSTACPVVYTICMVLVAAEPDVGNIRGSVKNEVVGCVFFNRIFVGMYR